MSVAQEVAVLMATRNSELFLQEQVASILQQRSVVVQLVVSDDQSTDSTLDIVRRSSPGAAGSITVLPPTAQRFGNANRNFLRLIEEAPLGNADYVSLADHDDVWFEKKIEKAIEVLCNRGADVYSSNVIAWWPNGRRTTIVKSQPQRRFDHLFESGGPGSTFVFTRQTFERLRRWVRTNRDRLAGVKVHDWLIYAYARSQGWRWVIDSHPGLLYRQHTRNELGANVGVRAALKRWQYVRQGQYRADILAIADAVNDASPIRRWLARLNASDRMRLAVHAGQCRRKKMEALVLAAMFLVMKRTKATVEL
jgi:rhamnosyltransferase